MSRTRGTMQEIANPGSEFTWATYAFAGNDPLEAALAPGYFAQWASRLQPGDLILSCTVSTDKKSIRYQPDAGYKGCDSVDGADIISLPRHATDYVSLDQMIIAEIKYSRMRSVLDRVPLDEIANAFDADARY